MLLLHTADWHLGRAFHGEDLLGAHAAWVDWLVDLARSERPDAVLVAGDLYDRAIPPVDAVRLADDALGRLAEVAPVIVISGNHDSAQRLRFAAPLLARAGLHVRTDPACSGEPIPVGDGVVYAVPYLEPDLCRAALGCEERGHGAVMAAALALVRADRVRRSGPACVVAHAFVAGAAGCDSERELVSVGGAASVPAAAFSGLDYVALGHLHGPQRVGRRARYAGSPLAFSFSEAGQGKSVCLVEVAAGAEPVVRPVACPVHRPLACLRGTLDELLADPRHAGAEGAWVQATLTDPIRPSDAMERLRVRFPHTAALAFEPRGTGVPEASGSYAARLAGLGDEELAARFVQDARGVPATEEELELLRGALGHRAAEAVA